MQPQRGGVPQANPHNLLARRRVGKIGQHGHWQLNIMRQRSRALNLGQPAAEPDANVALTNFLVNQRLPHGGLVFQGEVHAFLPRKRLGGRRGGLRKSVKRPK